MQQMVLEIGSRGLRALFFSPEGGEDARFVDVPLPEPQGAASSAFWGEEWLAALENAVYEHPLLLGEFSRVTLLVDSPRFIALPDLGSEEESKELFHRLMPDEEGGRCSVIVDALPGTGVRMGFEFDRRVEGFLRRTFHNVAIRHRLAPEVELFCLTHRTRRRGKTLVNYTGPRVDIIVLGDGAPLQVNSYRCEAVQDALYFTMLSRQTLRLPDTDEIMLAGAASRRMELAAMLRSYVPFVLPVIFPTRFYEMGHEVLRAPFEMIAQGILHTNAAG